MASRTFKIAKGKTHPVTKEKSWYEVGTLTIPDNGPGVLSLNFLDSDFQVTVKRVGSPISEPIQERPMALAETPATFVGRSRIQHNRHGACACPGCTGTAK